MSENWLSKNISAVIAIAFLLISFVIFSIVLIYGVRANDTVSIAIIETLKAIDMLIIGYYFGSSAGSKQKQNTIDNLTNDNTNKQSNA